MNAVFAKRPWLILVGIWLLMTFPWLSGDKAIPYDAVDEFFPGLVFSAQSLLRHEWPFWNPYVYSGYPSIVDPQAMGFAPTMVLPMLLNQSLWAFTVVVMLHVLLGGIGMLQLGQSYGWSTPAAILSAAIFMFGGVAAARLQHTPMLISWAWLPWLFVLVRRVFNDRRWRHTSWWNGIGLGIVGGLAGLQLTQVTFLGAIVFAAYVVYRVVAGWHEPERFRLFGHLTLAAIISLLIASPQLIATLSFLPYSNRPAFDFAAATANSFHLSGFLTLLSPNALGNVRGDYVGRNDITETMLYISALPILLIVLALVSRKFSMPKGEWRFWLVLLVGGVIYAVGANTPIYGLLHAYVPGISLFRRPTDGVFVVQLALAVMAGAAFNIWCAPNVQQPLRALLVLTAIAITAIIAIGVLHGTLIAWPSAVLLALAAWSLYKAQLVARAHWWIVGVLLCVLIDLRVNNLNNRLNAHKAVGLEHRSSLAANPAMALVKAKLAQDKDSYFRAEIPGDPMSASAAVFGVPVVSGYSPLTLPNYRAVTGIDPNPVFARELTGAFDSYDGKLNNLLGVRYLILRASVEKRLLPQLGRYQLLARFANAYGEDYAVWENPAALPRVLRLATALPLTNPTSLTPQMLNAVDLSDTAYLEAPAEELLRCGKSRAEFAAVETYSNNEVTLRVRTSGDAWVVLNDMHFAWWHASVSGTPTPIRRANGLFRAVCVPRGEHVVRFRFAPYTAIVERARHAEQR